MSNNYQFHSGTGDNNITYHNDAAGTAERELLARLLTEIDALRTRDPLPDTTAASLADSRALLAPDSDASPRERRSALNSVAAIATALGAIGTPVLGLVQQILGA
ncbi:hypothetical protein ABT160_15815 [Streptomyces sp. NPDC001941]|uniref:hypothetical protein n=1 Tax=Streptomyces sp. NPDC001941 TaxID=3154659 RepID=UPI003330184D